MAAPPPPPPGIFHLASLHKGRWGKRPSNNLIFITESNTFCNSFCGCKDAGHENKNTNSVVTNNSSESRGAAVACGACDGAVSACNSIAESNSFCGPAGAGHENKNNLDQATDSQTNMFKTPPAADASGEERRFESCDSEQSSGRETCTAISCQFCRKSHCSCSTFSDPAGAGHAHKNSLNQATNNVSEVTSLSRRRAAEHLAAQYAECCPAGDLQGAVTRDSPVETKIKLIDAAFLARESFLRLQNKFEKDRQDSRRTGRPVNRAIGKAYEEADKFHGLMQAPLPGPTCSGMAI